MKKTFLKICTFTLCVLLILPLSGCRYAARNRAETRVREIPVEVTGLAIAGENSILIDGKYYEYMKEAKKLVKGWNQDTYPDWYASTDEARYNFYQYGISGDYVRGKDDLVIDNKHRIDAAIFKMEYRTGKCSLLYDIKDIVPFGLFGVAHLPIIQRTVNNRYFLMHFSGKLEIFDFIDEKVIYSEQVYDPLRYTTEQSGAYARFMYDSNDYYYFGDDALNFYEYKGDTYQKYTFNDPIFELDLFHSIERIDDMLYANPWDKGMLYAVNFRTGEPIPLDEATQRRNAWLREQREKEENKPEPEPDVYRFGNGNYTIKSDEANYMHILTNVDTGEKCVLNADYLREHCDSFEKIEEIYNDQFPDNEDLSFELRGVTWDKERIFLTAYAYLFNTFLHGEVPSATFIYEYLPDTGEVKYCGYYKNGNDVNVYVI